MGSTQTPSLVERIPDPDTVRDRLSQAVREVELLRRMLRLSERAQKLQRHSEPQREAG